MASDFKDASTEPRQLLWKPSFWFSQKGLLSVALLTIAAGFLVAQLPTRGFDNLPLTFPMAIHLIAFGALLVAFRAAAETRVEHAIARIVGRRASEELSKIAAKQVERVDLARVEADYLPNNPSAELGILRLLQQILREAKDRQFHSSFVLMQPFKEGAFGRLAQLQTFQRIALHLGILGTFAGLVYAIAQLDFSADGTMAVGDIQPLLAALSLSFGTSIAGIEVAILIRLMSFVVVRRQAMYFDSMEETTVFFTSLTRNAINQDEYVAELGAVQVAMRQLGDRVLDQTQAIESQTGSIRTGIDRLVQTKSDFDSFANEVGATQGAFVEEMREIYQVLSPERLAQRFEETFQASSKVLDQELRQQLETALERFQSGLEPLLTLEQSLDKTRLLIDAHREGAQEDNVAFFQARQELGSEISRLVQRQDEWVGRLEEALPEGPGEELRGVLDELGDRVASAVRESESTEVVKAIRGTASRVRTESREVLAELERLKDEVSQLRSDGIRAVVVLWPFSWFRKIGQRGLLLIRKVLGWPRGKPASQETTVKLESRTRP